MIQATGKIGILLTAEASGVAAVAGKTQSTLLGMAKTLAGPVMGPLAALTSVTAFTGLIKSAMDAGVEISHMSRELGLSTDEYQRLGKMVKSVGGDEAGLAMAFRTFSRLITEGITEPAGPAADKLRMIGVTVDQLKGKSPAQQFEIIAKAIGSIKDPTERASRAVEAFGESGMKLSQLAMHYDEIKERANQARIMTEENIKASEAFNKSISSLGNSIQGALVDSGFIKWLADVADKIGYVAGKQKEISERAGKSGASGSYIESGRNSVSSFLADMVTQGKASEFRAAFRGEALLYMPGTSSQDAKAAKEKQQADQKKQVDEAAQAEKTRAEGASRWLDKEIAALHLKREALTGVNKTLTEQYEIAAKAKIAELQQTGKTIDPAHEARIKAEFQGMAADEQARRDAEEAKSMAGKLSDMDDEMRIQRLIIDGKEREAAIQKEIAAYEREAKEKGVAVDETIKARLAEKAGQRFDLDKASKKAPDVSPAMALDRGSAEAFRAENKTASSIDKLNNTARQQLEQQKKLGDYVDKIAVQQGSVMVLGALG